MPRYTSLTDIEQRAVDAHLLQTIEEMQPSRNLVAFARDNVASDREGFASGQAIVRREPGVDHTSQVERYLASLLEKGTSQGMAR